MITFVSLSFNYLRMKHITLSLLCLAQFLEAFSHSVWQASEIPPCTLFESFEDYDSTQVWLPENWTWESKTGIQRDNPDYNTWFTSSSFLTTRPSDGKHFEWINFSMTQRQDEWLITPSLVPQVGDTLFFDAYFSPFWMLFNMELEIPAIDFEHPASLLQAMISTDEGKNWTSLWRAIDDYRDCNYQELSSYFLDSEWHEIKIPLTDYAGQTVKIAFRYEGFFGDNNGLDRISVSRERPFTPKAPDASYDIPEGFFLSGLTPNGQGLAGIMFAPAYYPVVWRNTSFDAKQFYWEMPAVFGTETYISTEENPVERYIQDGYYFPILTVRWEDKTSEPYSWAIGTPNLPYGTPVFFAGGHINDHIQSAGLSGLGVGNFNLINGVAPYAFAEDSYVFGTRPDRSVDAIANYFRKPPQPYILKAVNIAVSNFEAPAGTGLELILHRSNENRALLDTIATCLWTTGKAITAPDFYNIGFDTGELLISDALLIELKGLNSPGISLACFSETIHNSPDNNNACLFQWQNGERTQLQTAEALEPGNATSLCFSLDLTYSYIAPQNLEYTLTCGMQKEEKTVDMTGYFPATTWNIASSVPSWLSVTIIPESGDNNVPRIRFATEELIEGIEKRYVTVSITDSKGGLCTFSVVQDLFAGIKPEQEAVRLIEVRNQSAAFELIYPGDSFNRLQIYTVSGQRIADCPLSSSGNFILPRSSLNRGIYFLQFTGKTTETVKIVLASE
jgi:hypothetical protein